MFLLLYLVVHWLICVVASILFLRYAGQGLLLVGKSLTKVRQFKCIFYHRLHKWSSTQRAFFLQTFIHFRSAPNRCRGKERLQQPLVELIELMIGNDGNSLPWWAHLTRPARWQVDIIMCGKEVCLSEKVEWQWLLSFCSFSSLTSVGAQVLS